MKHDHERNHMNQQQHALSVLLDYVDTRPKLFSRTEGTFDLFEGREFRFGVVDNAGVLMSDLWRVGTEGKGNVYVMSREGGGKVSLHASGAAHYKPRQEDRRSEVLNWNWQYGKPALHVLFWPEWGTPSRDNKSKKLWKKNDCLLGITDSIGVDVAFFRVAGDISVESLALISDVDGSVIPLFRSRMECTGDTMFVFARSFEPRRNLMELVDGAELRDLVNGSVDGGLRRLCLSGTTDEDGSGFLIPVQVKVEHTA